MEVAAPVIGHANTWYVDRLRTLRQHGDRVLTRGRWVREQLHAVTVLLDPRQRVLTVPTRRANPFFQAAETVWLLAGLARADWIIAYNSQLAQYLDPSATGYHGAYGERLRRYGAHERTGLAGPGVDQVALAVRQLHEDPHSRRAVLVLRNPALDRPDLPTADSPCNVSMTVTARGGALWAAMFNRSNDLNLGLAYTNIVQFTTLQEYVAAATGLDVGPYTHFSTSLHVYEDDPIVDRVLGSAGQPCDIYAHGVEPVAMLPRPLPELDATIALLVRVGDVARPLSAGDLAAAWQVPCPYWSSIGRMLLAWRALARGPHALDEAFALVGEMHADDWMAASAEYLYRWACRRGLRAAAEAHVKNLWLPEPVLAWVQHDPTDLVAV